MIDFDDSGDFAFLSMLFSGPFGILLLVLSIVFLFIALSNQEDCSKMHCDNGKPILTNNECLCVQKAKKP